MSIIFNPGGGSGGGSISGGANLGTGTGLYAGVSGSNLTFNSIAAGTNVSLSLVSNTLTVNATGEVNQGANVGGGTGIYAGMSGDNLTFNSLAADNGVSISSASNLITIQLNNLPVLRTNVTSQAATSIIYSTATANSVKFKGVAASGVKLTDDGAGTLNFDLGVESATVTGTDLYQSFTSGIIKLRKIAATDNFAIDDTTTPGLVQLNWNSATSTSSLSGITFTKSDTIEAAADNAAQTGNITLDPTGAKLGAVVTIVNHSDTVQPTITASTGAILVYAAGTYDTASARNRISIQYVGQNAGGEYEFEVTINAMTLL